MPHGTMRNADQHQLMEIAFRPPNDPNDCVGRNDRENLASRNRCSTILALRFSTARSHGELKSIVATVQEGSCVHELIQFATDRFRSPLDWLPMRRRSSHVMVGSGRHSQPYRRLPLANGR